MGLNRAGVKLKTATRIKSQTLSSPARRTHVCHPLRAKTGSSLLRMGETRVELAGGEVDQAKEFV
jgi:hypothetical protein